jgi:hypothetical protein
MGFVVDNAALGQVFSEYFSFPYETFHGLLHTHYSSSSSGAVAIGHLVASVIVDSVPLYSQEKSPGFVFYLGRYASSSSLPGLIWNSKAVCIGYCYLFPELM